MYTTRGNLRAAVLILCLLASAAFALVADGEDPGSILQAIEAELIPAYGSQTDYGIPLDLRNTAQFIDWFRTIELTADEAAIRDRALEALPAPCCDDNSAATCCCECNLARSVWGLSAYLVRERGYGVESLRAAASDWLRFARPDYSVAAELEDRGLDPEDYGLTTYGSCYRGRCGLPVTEGGCAGMTDLVEPDPETLPTVTPPDGDGAFVGD